MDADRFDTLARALTRIRSRRSLARVLGGSVLAGTLGAALLPRQAEADAKKRCRRKGGALLSHGNCRCAYKCPSTENFPCLGDESCMCGETTEGKGFCSGQLITGSTCLSSSQCESGTKCVFLNCTGTGCTTSTDCPADYACKRGLCRQGVCFGPCLT
jgi:hypothetical protein